MVFKNIKFLLSAGCVVLNAACAGQTESETTRESLTQSLSSLQPMCPSALLPDKATEFENLSELCSVKEDYCISRCSGGDENACFGLANNLGQEAEGYALSQLLYKQSCNLGLPSGCTNAGAGLLNVEESQDGICMLDTFRGACSMGDPWGCTMQAIMQSDTRFINLVERDFDAALEALEGSCVFGLEDPACSGAKDMEKMIKDALND